MTSFSITTSSGLGGSVLGSAANRFAISIAASAASNPLLPILPPARSSACSVFSVVSTPHVTGIPLLTESSPIPFMRLPGDVVEVRGLAPDDGTDAHDRVDLARASPSAAAASRDLERARDPRDGQRFVGNAVSRQAVERSLDEALAYRLVEPARHDRDAEVACIERTFIRACHRALLRSGAEAGRPVSRVQQVTHLLPLRRQVSDVLGVRHALERYPVDDLKAVALEPGPLRRVVGQQAHRRDTEIHEDLGADPVVTCVGSEAELDVRLDRVEALVLERVRLELVAQPDPAALVSPYVDDDAFALFVDLLHRFGQLRPAVAADAAQHVTGEALGVHAHEDVLLARWVALDERDVRAAVVGLVGDRPERAERRRDASLGHAL